MGPKLNVPNLISLFCVLYLYITKAIGFKKLNELNKNLLSQHFFNQFQILRIVLNEISDILQIFRENQLTLGSFSYLLLDSFKEFFCDNEIRNLFFFSPLLMLITFSWTKLLINSVPHLGK